MSRNASYFRISVQSCLNTSAAVVGSASSSILLDYRCPEVWSFYVKSVECGLETQGMSVLPVLFAVYHGGQAASMLTGWHLPYLL